MEHNFTTGMADTLRLVQSVWVECKSTRALEFWYHMYRIIDIRKSMSRTFQLSSAIIISNSWYFPRPVISYSLDWPAMKSTTLSFCLFLVSSAFASVEKRNTVCYDPFGCFSSDGLLKTPQSTSVVNTYFRLYVQGHSSHINEIGGMIRDLYV